MQNVAGSEMRTIGLYRILKQTTDVHIWSEGEPEPSLARAVPIRRIRPRRGQFPLLGTLVFVGFYYWVGRWTRLSLARRRIIICNTMPKSPASFEQARRRVAGGGWWPVELAYACEEVSRAIGQPGPVLASPIDLARFSPRPGPRPHDTFRVGRMSRDVECKHHEASPELYRRLIGAGCTVRIMGGTVLRQWMGDAPAGLELLPHASEDAATFLQSLDCFVYRTSDTWYETFGRVIFEAMACGLPVIVHRRGGYAEFLEDGQNALLFDTDEEAYELILRLKADAALRQRLARGARSCVEAMNSHRYTEELTEYFIRGGSARKR